MSLLTEVERAAKHFKAEVVFEHLQIRRHMLTAEREVLAKAAERLVVIDATLKEIEDEMAIFKAEIEEHAPPPAEQRDPTVPDPVPAGTTEVLPAEQADVQQNV